MSTIAPVSTIITNALDIQSTFKAQQKNQYAVARASIGERKAKLERLHACVLAHREDIQAAMTADFKKSPVESDLTETAIILGTIRHTISNLSAWTTPKRVSTPLKLFGSFSYIHYEPKGVCLLISPWNFPFNLTLAPLALAVAAGNCVMIKPSEMTPHSAALMKKIIGECFSPDEVALFEGDATVAQQMLELPFNHIFFTGSPAVGKIVMTAAAKNLTSVTLELGGKSPVIVDETADLDNAAAKIAWINCMNAGQICIEPDYVLVHESKKDELVRLIGQKIEKFYGKTTQDRQKNPDFCRIVNKRHFNRIKNLLDDAVQKGANISFGGTLDENDCFIEPTILENIPATAIINQEEIFGPILPIYTYKNREDAVAYINAGPKPLALYVFSSKNRQIDWFIDETRSGTVCVNDCAVHFFNPNLPFGGSNNSGIGKSHGELGFQEFCNPRGVMKQNRLYPITNLLLPPYRGALGNLIKESVVKWM